MENTTLDMQASLNAKGVFGLFVHERDKLPEANQHTQSTAFISLLGEKRAQTTHDEPSAEKVMEGPDCQTTKTDFTGMPTLLPLPLETGYKLCSDPPIVISDDIKSLALTDDAQSVVLSFPTVMNSRNITGDMVKPVISALTEMTNQPQPQIQNSSGENTPTIEVLGKIPHSASGSMKPLHLSTSENTVESPSDNELKPVMPPIGVIAYQTRQSGENSTTLKLGSVSATNDKTNREMDQSAAIQTSVTQNNMKSAMPLNTDIKDQSDHAQINNTAAEAVSVALGVTDADISLPEADSSSTDHVTSRIRPTKSEHRAETESTDQVAEALNQKDNKSAFDGVFSDLRRMTVSYHDNRTDTAVQKEGRYIVTAAQKPAPVANNRVTAIGEPVSTDLWIELPDKAVFMKNAPAGTTAGDQDFQQIGNTLPDRHHKTTSQEGFPFRVEMTNILSTQTNRSSTTNFPAGINTQAVIDQILDAKQSLNNGFGRVRITLDPPNLGTVNLEIVVRKERVEVVITADTSGVQQALQSRADDIRIALQRQDLKIETFQVLLQENTTNHQQANSGATFEQSLGHKTRQNLIDDSIPVQPLIQPIGQSERARGLVSIFV